MRSAAHFGCAMPIARPHCQQRRVFETLAQNGNSYLCMLSMLLVLQRVGIHWHEFFCARAEIARMSGPEALGAPAKYRGKSMHAKRSTRIFILNSIQNITLRTT